MGISVVISNGSLKPIYAQIPDQVRAAIHSGEAPPGTELPSLRRLARTCGERNQHEAGVRGWSGKGL